MIYRNLFRFDYYFPLRVFLGIYIEFVLIVVKIFSENYLNTIPL